MYDFKTAKILTIISSFQLCLISTVWLKQKKKKNKKTEHKRKTRESECLSKTCT